MEGLTSSAAVAASLVVRFRERAGANGVLSFADFMALALYDPDFGYYRAPRERIGRSRAADFYTSSEFRTVFGRLVVAAATKLVGAKAVAEHTFVEIGAEPRRGIMDGAQHNFAALRTIHVGEAIQLPPHAIVFSNELFDAQPFHRVVFENGSWHEQGVRWNGDRFEWVALPRMSVEVAAIRASLPAESHDGYILDLPLRAVRLLRAIAAPDWRGLFLAFDYGRTWRELYENYPSGTGRAYARHRQQSDLLATPGSQDLTCHVCWDWLEAALREAGFSTPQRESQEAFFIHHAADAIESIVREHGSAFATERSHLRELLHPGLMGQRFEALWALRR